MVDTERDRPAATERGDVAGDPGRAPPPRETPPPPPHDERRKRGKGKAAGGVGEGERRDDEDGEAMGDGVRRGRASRVVPHRWLPALSPFPSPSLSLPLPKRRIEEEKREERRKEENKRRGLHMSPTSFLFYWVGCHANETKDQYCHGTKIVWFYIV